MAATSVSSFDGLAGQELASRLHGMRWNLHLQLCDKIRRDYLIRRDDKNLWSGDGVSPDHGEEENHVSSGNKEGGLDDGSGSNDVKLNFLPDGGGIEEPEHKTAETVISHRTDGLESFAQSVIVQWLREHVNLDNWETIFQNIDLDDKICFEQDILPCPHALITDRVSTDNEKEDFIRRGVRLIKKAVQKVRRGVYGVSTDNEEEDFIRRGVRFIKKAVQKVRRGVYGVSIDNEEEDFILREDFFLMEEEEEEQVILPPRPAISTVIVSTDFEEEDSSENKVGRLDDGSGSNDVRLNFLPDGGGIEEPEHKTAETIISHGTDGLESCVQSVIAPFLRARVNLNNRETTFRDFDLQNVPRTNPLYLTQLNQIINNVSIDFSRMLETNPDLSLEDLKVYCVPLCWSSKKRVDFWSHLSDELLLRADELKELMLELERTWQLHFGEKQNDKIDDELLSSADELKKLTLELERTWQLHFGEKRNRKMDDKLLSRVDELKKLMLELQRTWQLHFGEKRNDKIDELLSRADKLKKLRLELERTWQLHFGEKRNKIDEEWINEFSEKWRPHFGGKWIDRIDEEWIENFGKKWTDKKIEIEEWMDKNIEQWIENVDPKYKPRGPDFIYVRGLLHFLRN